VNDLIIPAKEILERGNINSSLFKSESRSGIKSVTGTIPLEFKSGDSFAAPEYAILLESALGNTTAAGAGTTSTTGHSTTLINMDSTSEFAVGDIVLVEESGAYHVSPIASLVTDTSITLLVAAASSFSDSVVVKKLLDYRTADSGHKSFSATKYNEDAVRETAAGCKVASMAMENWTTGQMPKLTIGYEGLSFTRTVSANGLTPSFDSSLPVVALQACIYKDGTALVLNDFSWSLENTLAPKTSTCDENGRVAIRVSGTTITGSINPYKKDDAVTLFDNWDDDDTFSLFAVAYNPTAVSGEFNEIVAMYFPTCQFNEITQTDINGLAQDNLTFEVKKDSTINAVIAVG